MITYKDKLIESLKEGLLLLVKYGLIIILIVYSYLFFMSTYQMSINGNNAAVAIRMFQEKGYLPAFVNGSIPEKSK